jgi:hypothetical protein
MSALLLLLCGVEQGAVVQDYVRSEANLKVWFPTHVRSTRADLQQAGHVPAMTSAALDVWSGFVASFPERRLLSGPEPCAFAAQLVGRSRSCGLTRQCCATMHRLSA